MKFQTKLSYLLPVLFGFFIMSFVMDKTIGLFNFDYLLK
jgi:hypothetical protein